MPFNIIQCHSLSLLTVTILSCSLQLPLLDLSLSLSLLLPLPLDEPVLIDAKEDKEIAPFHDRIHAHCTNTSSHNTFAVQVSQSQ